MTTLLTWRIFAFVYIIFNATERAFASVNIHGVTGGIDSKTGERPSRRDITEFQSSGPAFDLYIQALKEFQEDDRENILSYYKVAGIHGYPFVAWDGVEGSQESGYCSHGSTLFPLWHRPYLALVEEIIWNKAQKIASSYPKSQRPEYESAANTLRIPYWDWASDPEMPKCAVIPEIEINTPRGRRRISNPLYSYRINPTTEDGFPSWSKLSGYPTTVRSPDRRGRGQNERSQEALRSIGSSLRINTYELLASETNYTIFSTASIENRGENYNSLEAIHDIVHDRTGGDSGHMTYIPWAAFDPIFWLHHAQLDRIMALWQVLNPDTYVVPLPNTSGDFVKEPGTMEDINTPLTPFHIEDGKFHTAETVRYIKSFGYTYPEIQDWNVEPEELQRCVRQQINELYNKPRDRDRNTEPARRPHAHNGLFWKHKKRHLGNKKRNLDSTVSGILDAATSLVESVGNVGTTSLEHFADLGINNLETQYVINVKVDTAAHPAPFKVSFFLSDPPADPSSWATASNLVGTAGGYSTTGSIVPAPVEEKHKHIFHSQIPLSHTFATLRSRGVIDSYRPKTVIPVLEEHLEWRIVTFDGEVIDTKEFMEKGGSGEALEVRIAGRVAGILKGEERIGFPEFGAWEVYEGGTKGKIGGYNSMR